MIMAHKKEKNRDRDVNDDTNMQAHRDPAQSKDFGGEAQNVADDTVRPLQNGELDLPAVRQWKGFARTVIGARAVPTISRHAKRKKWVSPTFFNP